jgi:glycerol kinase
MAIWESQRLAMSRLEQAISPEQRQAVISCGITNQRETTTLWKRSDGSPCGPAALTRSLFSYEDW